MGRVVGISFGLIAVVIAVFVWVGNRYISTQFATCITPSRVTKGVVVIGTIVSVKDAGDEMVVTLELCGKSTLFISSRVTVVSPSGFIVVGKKQEDGYYWGSVHAKDFIDHNLHHLVAVRVNPSSSNTPTQNMVIEQAKKPDAFRFLLLPTLFFPPVLHASEYAEVATLLEAQKMINEGGL